MCVNEWVLANDSCSVQNRLRLGLRTDSGWGGEAAQGLGSPSPCREKLWLCRGSAAAVGTRLPALGLVLRRGIT